MDSIQVFPADSQLNRAVPILIFMGLSGPRDYSLIIPELTTRGHIVAIAPLKGTESIDPSALEGVSLAEMVLHAKSQISDFFTNIGGSELLIVAHSFGAVPLVLALRDDVLEQSRVKVREIKLFAPYFDSTNPFYSYAIDKRGSALVNIRFQTYCLASRKISLERDRNGATLEKVKSLHQGFPWIPGKFALEMYRGICSARDSFGKIKHPVTIYEAEGDHRVPPLREEIWRCFPSNRPPKKLKQSDHHLFLADDLSEVLEPNSEL